MHGHGEDGGALVSQLSDATDSEKVYVGVK
jgi:hypothetical protein